MWWNLKKPTSLFKCWLRNRNFTQNTLDTRCQINILMWPHKIWQFWGGKSYRWFTPQITKYDLPQIVCMIHPPKIAREDLPLKSPSTIYPPQIVQFWAKFQTHTTSCFASQRSFLRKTNFGGVNCTWQFEG